MTFSWEKDVTRRFGFMIWVRFSLLGRRAKAWAGKDWMDNGTDYSLEVPQIFSTTPLVLED